MVKVDVKTDPFDIEFRTAVADYIRKSQTSIKIVTGEIAAYSFLDLRSAAEQAAKRGVKIDVYASGPDADITNRLISIGINVYKGSEDPLEHFMIVDNKDVIVSFKKPNRARPSPIGKRRAIVSNEKIDVQKYLEIFRTLTKNAKLIETTDNDPLARMLDKNLA